MKNQRGGIGVRLVSLALPIVGIVMLAPVVLASSGAEVHGSGALLKDFLYRCMNFFIMLAGLGFVVARPVKSALRKRRQGIEESLEEARIAKAAAEQGRKDLEDKLAAANADMQRLLESVAQDGRVQRERVLEQARKLAGSVVEEVAAVATREKESIRQEVKQQAVAMAVHIAEEILQKELSKEDHARLVDKYLHQVGG